MSRLTLRRTPSCSYGNRLRRRLDREGVVDDSAAVVWLKVAANYVVPFLASGTGTGALLAVRRRAPVPD